MRVIGDCKVTDFSLCHHNVFKRGHSSCGEWQFQHCCCDCDHFVGFSLIQVFLFISEESFL